MLDSNTDITTDGHVARFAKLFAGFEDARGAYTLPPGEHFPGQKIDKGAIPETLKGGATLEDFGKHLAGSKAGLGIIPIRKDGTCVFGAIDIDLKCLPDVPPGLEPEALASAQRANVLSLVKKVERLDIPLIPTWSKSKALHLWYFLKTPISASDLIALLSRFKSQLGLGPTVEVFPKQEEIEDGDSGNWINLPFYGDARFGIQADGSPMPLAEFLDLAENLATENSAPEPEAAPEPDEQEDGGDDDDEARPDPSEILAQVIKELAAGKFDGGRNNAGFRFFCRLRDAGITRAQAADLKTAWRDAAIATGENSGPYTAREVAASLRSAYKREPRARFQPLPEAKGYFMLDRPHEKRGGIYRELPPKEKAGKAARARVAEEPESEKAKLKKVCICTLARVLAHPYDLETGPDGKKGADYRSFSVKTREGDLQKVTIPEASFDEVGWMKPLKEQGFVAYEREATLAYFKKSHSPRRGFIARRTGWHSVKGLGIFVLPEHSWGADPGEVELIPKKLPLNCRGTAEEWRAGVGSLCHGNDQMIFAVNCALSAILLPLTEVFGDVNPGVHFHGQSTRGKTTLLEVAGSVIGGPRYMISWSGTATGLEIKATERHSLPLILDEIGRAPAKQLGTMIYMLGEGEGKSRGTSEIKEAKTQSWRTFMISSGEKTVETILTEAGQVPKEGQDVRLLNIPAIRYEHGAFQNIHGEKNGADFSNLVKRRAGTSYGKPLREFLDKFFDDPEPIIARFEARAEALAREWAASCKADAAAVQRSAQTFALAAAAGEIAADLGVTGFRLEECTSSAKAIFDHWLEGRGTPGSKDADRWVKKVRQYVEEGQSSKFRDLDDNIRVFYTPDGERREVEKDPPRLTVQAGYIKRKDLDKRTEIWIHRETFRQDVCKGLEFMDVGRYLREHGILIAPENGSLTVKRSHTSPDVSGSFYVLSKEKLLGVEWREPGKPTQEEVDEEKRLTEEGRAQMELQISEMAKT